MSTTIEPEIRLTQTAKRAGCAAKQSPDFLFSLLPSLPEINDPNVIVGSATADDAAIYRISEDLALVLTTDFFTPIVDRPSDFGAIAAANALSDVYAMGAKPLAALSLVGFPTPLLPKEALRDILTGAALKVKECGIDIVGGHSIKSEEPIFGLAVVGTVHPERFLSNQGANPGDLLILTKPIGLGIITTAAKNGEDRFNAIENAIGVMSTLNQRASQILAGASTRAMTDVTGFGLLGHLRNIVNASDVGAEIYLESIPTIPHAWEYVRDGIAPGGTHSNHKFLSECVAYSDDLTKEEQLMVCDAQTSGGLLAAVESDSAASVLNELHDAGMSDAAIVGKITSDSGRIQVFRTA